MQVVIGNLGSFVILAWELNVLHKPWEEVFTELSQAMVEEILNS